MKVAILTIHSINLGNRLQNYALQEYLKSKKIHVETLQRTVDNRNFFKKIKQTVGCYIKHDKLSCFRWFDRKINWSKDIVSNEHLTADIADHYDFVVAGSDQIWNPYFGFNSELEFITFVPKEKRVSYAASFGVSKIEQKYAKNYAKLLSGIDHCSVREECGQEIVLELTGKSPVIMPDPTILLMKNNWLRVERHPAFAVSKKFFFVYFIGEYTEKTKKKIHFEAEKYEANVIEIIKDRSELDGQVGPAEFLWLVHHSERTFTDSYHGSVLTLLIQRKGLVIFPRQGDTKDMSSRFDTLWDIFGIRGKIEKSADNIYVPAEAMKGIEDYQELLISKADNFLKNAFGTNLE